VGVFAGGIYPDWIRRLLGQCSKMGVGGWDIC